MKEIFQQILTDKIENMKEEFIDLNSGLIHREVGGYPGRKHRMPICCDVMKSFMKEDDEILSSPPKGNGASLTIRYYKKNHWSVL